MTPSLRAPLTGAFYLLLLIMGLALFPAANAYANGKGGLEACAQFQQNRAVIAADLQSRRFILEAKGKVEPAPLSPYAQERLIYHRTFSVSLDAADQVSLYNCDKSTTCLMARDPARTIPLKIPVFFVGGAGEALEDLAYYAERAAFAPSESLSGGKSFADIQFQLRRSGSRFSDIRPFFRCGLPGLMLCEGTCPDETAPLAATLINWAVKPEPQKPEPVKPAQTVEAAKTNKGQTSSQAEPEPSQISKASPSGQSATPAAPATSPNAKQPKSSEEHAQTNSPSPQKSTEAAPPPAKSDSQGSPAAPSGSQSQSAARRHLVLTFVLDSGHELKASQVLAAEGQVSFEGIPFALAQDGLAADLPDDVLQTASTPENLSKIWRHHSFVSMIVRESNILVTLQPKYVVAEDLAIKIEDASGAPVERCILGLEVFPGRRLGPGWAKLLGQDKGLLTFSYETTDYRLDAPAEAQKEELLIDTSQERDPVRISNQEGPCELEARPIVTADELRNLTISRKLSQTGRLLFAIVSASDDFATALSAASAQFWVSALDLAETVSKAQYEREILARAQSPGVSANTKVLLSVTGQSFFARNDSGRSRILNLLNDASRKPDDARANIRVEAVRRAGLDLALKTIRDGERISPQHSFGQEDLLFIAGSLKTAGSEFCNQAIRAESASAVPQWLSQARKAFILEIWSKFSIDKMQKEQKAEPVEGAAGLYRCRAGGSGGEKIAFYALDASSITEDGAMAKAFSFLTAKAESHLRP